MHYVSWLGFHCFDKDHNQRQHGEKSLFQRTCPEVLITVHHQEKSGQEPKAETEARDQGETLRMGLLSLLFYIPEDHLTRAGTTRRRLGPPISIINHENATQTYIQGNLMEAFSQLRFFFLDMSRFVST